MRGVAPLVFPKSARVLRPAEFRRIYDHGVRLSTPLFVAFRLARPETESGAGARLGITIPRAVAGAVDRNRIKRRLRELFRHRRTDFGAYDWVVNPRRAILAASPQDLARAVDKLLGPANR